MLKTFKRVLCAGAMVALAATAQTGSASALSIHPMTFDECGTNGDGAYNCMYISGGGNMATEVRGWSEPGKNFIGTNVHEEVSYPNGTALCNSSSVTISSSTEVVGCQLSPGGSFPIPTGTYCATLWSWDAQINVITGQSYWTWKDAAQNCGTVSD